MWQIIYNILKEIDHQFSQVIKFSHFIDWFIHFLKVNVCFQFSFLFNSVLIFFVLLLLFLNGSDQRWPYSFGLYWSYSSFFGLCFFFFHSLSHINLFFLLFISLQSHSLFICEYRTPLLWRSLFVNWKKS
jgi:hypothetical protein